MISIAGMDLMEYCYLFFVSSDGSYYFRNPDNSRYYNNGRGFAVYTDPNGYQIKGELKGQYTPTPMRTYISTVTFGSQSPQVYL